MKRILLMVFTLAFALHTKAQKADTLKTPESTPGRANFQKAVDPLIVIDGNKQYLRGLAAAKVVSPENIALINIIKDSAAVEKYGADGINGVIEIETKNASPRNYNSKIDTNTSNLTGMITGLRFEPNRKSSILKRNLLQKDSDPKAKPLYIIDGKEMENADAIDPGLIESVTVLKDTAATSRYKEKGKNGVIIITTKGNSPTPEKN